MKFNKKGNIIWPERKKVSVLKEGNIAFKCAYNDNGYRGSVAIESIDIIPRLGGFGARIPTTTVESLWARKCQRTIIPAMRVLSS